MFFSRVEAGFGVFGVGFLIGALFAAVFYWFVEKGCLMVCRIVGLKVFSNHNFSNHSCDGE